ncbi:MAG TPA: F0F1 ATP synthase subunit delta [Candidatus Saccharimonadales bacterium]
MAQTISRRKLAAQAASRLSKGESVKSVMRELGAYLIDQKRTKELSLIVRDIETALISGGTVVVTTTSARALSAEAKQTIEKFITSQYDDVKKVVLRENIDESVIGGVKLETADQVLDGTIKTKLEKLTA